MARRRGGTDWKDVLPGLAILAALLVASTLTFLMDQVRRRFAEGPRVIVLAAEGEGLQPGSTVWIAGKPSGRVLGIRFDDPAGPESSRVVIESVLRREAMPQMRADARASIGASGLLAPAVLKLTPGTGAAPPLRSGDTLRVHPTPDLERFRSLADTVREAIGTLSADRRRLAARLEDGPGSVARFRDDPAALARLDSVRLRSVRLTATLREGDGLARLARDDSVRAALRRTAAALREIEAARRAGGASDSLLALMDAASGLGERAARLAAGLGAARGTAGRALHDPALAEQTAAAREALRALGPALVADPLRWLRIRLF
jgi:phospholipid/cholesterol/gamma-HCH transport system substrate-binding protein